MRTDGVRLDLAPVDALEARLLRLDDQEWQDYAVSAGLIELAPGGFVPTGDPAVDAWLAEQRAMDGDGDG